MTASRHAPGPYTWDDFVALGVWRRRHAGKQLQRCAFPSPRHDLVPGRNAGGQVHVITAVMGFRPTAPAVRRAVPDAVAVGAYGGYELGSWLADDE